MIKMDYSALKVGDEVGTSDVDNWVLSQKIETIDGETKSFFLIKGEKFRKSDGKGYGNGRKLVPAQNVRDYMKSNLHHKIAKELGCKFSTEFSKELDCLIEKHKL